MKSHYQPLISIVTTSYNYSNYISQTIDSVINQTYTNWELIIIDDGSIDNSVEIIKQNIQKYPDTISLHTHSGNINKGIKATYELGFTKIKGDYTAFLESDDAWDRRCLERKLQEIKKNDNISLVYSDMELIGDTNKRYYDFLEYLKFVGKRINSNSGKIYESLCQRNPVGTFSNIFIKSHILNDFKINAEYEMWSDWQLLLHASRKGVFKYVDEKLVKWRIHAQSANQAFESKENILSLQRSFINKYLSTNNNMLRDYPNRLKRILHNFSFLMTSPAIVIRKIFNK